MNETDAVSLFKCLADRSRLQILRSLAEEDMYVERLAERLSLTPATVSFHLKKLEAVGAVRSRREQYYTVYSLCRGLFETKILDVLTEESDEAAEQRARDEAYRKKIVDTFFRQGRLLAIPAQRKKARVCMEELARDFQPGKLYDEREVNEIILRRFDDYCSIRRRMLEEGLMRREGTVYTRIE